MVTGMLHGGNSYLRPGRGVFTEWPHLHFRRDNRALSAVVLCGGIGRDQTKSQAKPDRVSLCMSDKKEALKYTAAAAVLRLPAIKESGAAVKKKALGKKSKK
jgi:hypothetical protein